MISIDIIGFDKQAVFIRDGEVVVAASIKRSQMTFHKMENHVVFIKFVHIRTEWNTIYQ